MCIMFNIWWNILAAFSEKSLFALVAVFSRVFDASKLRQTMLFDAFQAILDPANDVILFYIRFRLE